MRKQKVNAVFDIGKTNKKFFLFDVNYNEVHKEYISFPQVEDEDGFPTENLLELRKWLLAVLNRILQGKKFQVKSINFSTYGASLVHLDKKGNVLTPLYNYLKPIPDSVINDFHSIHGDELEIASATASPPSGMLNAGMQLFWLKRTKPEVYAKIHYSLHFPQYLSYLFTGIALSEYTSIGCHTGMWDYEQNDYHSWIYKEKIDKILPPIVATQTSINMNYLGQKMKIGIGIHDSSAALIPYLFSETKPFLLLSTGTWSIALNPFNQKKLTKKDIQNNCLNYMRIDGKRVKATRFFIGNEYKIQVKTINEHYNKPNNYDQSVQFNIDIYNRLVSNPYHHFSFKSINKKHTEPHSSLENFNSFEEAYHQLMIELLEHQFTTIETAIGDSDISKIYVDGGFTGNDVFIRLIANHFRTYKVRTTQSPLGSALGAAMVIGNQKLDKRFLKDHYKMQKLSPLQMSN